MMYTYSKTVKAFYILLGVFIFIRLALADNSISLDRDGYIGLIDELSRVSFSNVIARSIETFPYFETGEFGQYEFGFVALLFPFAKILPAAITWALIGTISLAIKTYILLKSKVAHHKIILMIVCSLILMESNALRAGCAVTLLMLAYTSLIKRDLKRSILLFLLATLVHISTLIFIFFVFLGVIFSRLRVHKIWFLTFAILVLTGLFSLDFPKIIDSLIYGYIPLFSSILQKLSEYYIRVEFLGITGNSGFTLSSILCLAYFIKFYINSRFTDLDHNKIQSSTIGMIISSICFYFLMIGGFTVFWNRIWQSSFFLFLLLDSFSKPNILPKSIYVITTDRFISFLLAFYIVGNLVIRYPQSNIFEPLVPHVFLETLDTPE